MLYGYDRQYSPQRRKNGTRWKNKKGQSINSILMDYNEVRCTKNYLYSRKREVATFGFIFKNNPKLRKLRMKINYVEIILSK